MITYMEKQIFTIEEIRKRIAPIIKKHYIGDVYLFGSYARKEANANSDIDLYCDSGDLKSLIDLSALKEEFENVLGKRVDIVTIGSKMNDYFKKQIEADKIKLF